MTLVRVLSRWVSRAESGRRASSSLCDTGAGEAEAPSTSAEPPPGRKSLDGGRMSSGGSGDTGTARIAGGRDRPCKMQRARRNGDPVHAVLRKQFNQAFRSSGRSFRTEEGRTIVKQILILKTKERPTASPRSRFLGAQQACSFRGLVREGRTRTARSGIEAKRRRQKSPPRRRSTSEAGLRRTGVRGGPDRSRSGSRFGNYFPLKARTFFRHGLRGETCVLSQGHWEG